MIHQNNLSGFVAKLRRTLPGIQSLQILTTDGLAMISDNTPNDNDTRHSALSTLLDQGARQLAFASNANETPKGIIICLDLSAYVVARLNDDYVLGLQVPAEMNQPWLLKTIHGFISDQACQLHITS